MTIRRPAKRRSTVKIAERAAVEDFAAGLNEAFLECRRQGHDFKLRNVEEDAAANVYDLLLRCSRCKSERIVSRSKNGARVSDRVHYAEGYLMHGLGRMDTDGRDAIWLETIVRHQTKQAKRSR